MTEPINIAEVMDKLIHGLATEGLNEIQFPDIQKECRDQWGEDYAIAHGFGYFEGFGDDSPYFDAAQLYRDLQELIKDTFSGDPTIKIGFYGWPPGLGEVEVYRELCRGKFVREEATNKVYILLTDKICTDGTVVKPLDDLDPWHRAYPNEIGQDNVDNLTEALKTFS